MLRAAVKLPLKRVFVFSPHAGPGTTWVNDPVLDFYPSSHACARLPETVQSRSRTRAAVPLRGGRPSARPFANRTRRAREVQAPALRDFDDRPRRHDALGDIPPERDDQLAGHRDNPDPARAFALSKISRSSESPSLIPLRERALRLPPHPDLPDFFGPIATGEWR